MSGPLNPPRSMRNTPARNLAYMMGELLDSHEYRALTPENQQKGFNYAMEILYRPSTNNNQENLARVMLRTLADDYSRSWTTHPSSRYFNAANNNYNPNANLFLNRNNSMPNQLPPAARAPNYSKASNAVKKWLAARPHTIHQNVVNIKLPANAQDPVSYTNFKVGNEAVMVIKKRLLSNGAMRSRRTFYNKNTIERLAQGKKWRTILRMKGADAVFKDPINRRTVYRRDLMNVKFL